MGSVRQSVRWQAKQAVWAAVAMLAFPAASLAVVNGDVIRAGFATRGMTSNRTVVRPGTWTPVVVQLNLEGQAQFNGALRLAQRDRDGDVCYDYQPVTLTAESRPLGRFTLYGLPTTDSDGAIRIRVELLDDEGAVVRMVSGGELVTAIEPADWPAVLQDDEDLVLNISERQMGRVAHLTDPKQGAPPMRDVNIAHISPGDIPERWQGLEAADYIIWDDANPDDINQAQRRALAAWVRQGGVLVLATAKHAAALQKSDVFKPLLPVKIGTLGTLDDPSDVRRYWLGMSGDEASEGYLDPVPAVACVLRDDPDCRELLPIQRQRQGDREKSTLIARKRVGRGVVVFAAAPLHKLVDPDGDAARFYRNLLELRTSTNTDGAYNYELHLPLEAKIGFSEIGSLFLVFAMLFAMAYVGLSTFGSWGFLKSRGWSRHNWTAFAVVAGVASVVGLSAAQWARGVGQKLKQLTVVDATAGQREATAAAYFGLKTGTHSELDVWLAKDYAQQPEPAPSDCYLRPLPATRGPGDSRLTYADQRTYDLRPATAELLHVPVRATLKQFEGRWRGTMPGSVEASISIIDRTFEKAENDDTPMTEPCFTGASTITNKLGVDLESCVLFQPTSERLLPGSAPISARASEIIVHQLGAIPDGKTVQLAPRLYYEPAGGKLTWDRWHRTLLDWHNQWGRFARTTLSGPDDKRTRDFPQERYREVLMLLSTLSEYDEDSSGIKGYDQLPIMFSRQRCRPLDLSNLLTKDMILLVGFAKNDPGPANLCTRSKSTRPYKRLEPEDSWTVYRIVIPVDR